MNFTELKKYLLSIKKIIGVADIYGLQIDNETNDKLVEIFKEIAKIRPLTEKEIAFFSEKAKIYSKETQKRGAAILYVLNFVSEFANASELYANMQKVPIFINDITKRLEPKYVLLPDEKKEPINKLDKDLVELMISNIENHSNDVEIMKEISKNAAKAYFGMKMKPKEVEEVFLESIGADFRITIFEKKIRIDYEPNGTKDVRFFLNDIDTWLKNIDSYNETHSLIANELGISNNKLSDHFFIHDTKIYGLFLSMFCKDAINERYLITGDHSNAILHKYCKYSLKSEFRVFDNINKQIINLTYEQTTKLR